MTNEEMAIKLAELDQSAKSAHKRIDGIEEVQKETSQLVRSVDRLAQSVEIMAEEQKRQGSKIDDLENNKNETIKFWARTIIGCIITGLIGFGLANIFN